jgi:uncharacterized membrane protein YheB (UPF0754 family)|tara:strand:+ start:236 stop:775 length:540 start_codon:yes stop_codon:yes gene_type:complete
MDKIISTYYSTIGRVKNLFTRVVEPSDYRVYAYKAEPANEAQRSRVADMRRQELLEKYHHELNHEKARVSILEADLAKLNEQLKLSCGQMDQIESTQNALEELATRNSSPNYDNADQIIERLKDDIIQSLHYEGGTEQMPEVFVNKCEEIVTQACDKLDTEIGEILSGRQDYLAQEEHI